VGEEGDEASIRRLQLLAGDPHEGEILRNEHLEHPHLEDRRPSGDGSRGTEEENHSADAGRRCEPERVLGQNQPPQRRLAVEQPAGPGHAQSKCRQQQKRADPVPCVQVAVSDVGEKGGEADAAGDE
jgi:hypothetical protein